MTEEKQKKFRLLIYAFFSLIVAMFAVVAVVVGLIVHPLGGTTWQILGTTLKIMWIPIVAAIGIFAGYYFLVFKKEE